MTSARSAVAIGSLAQRSASGGDVLRHRVRWAWFLRAVALKPARNARSMSKKKRGFSKCAMSAISERAASNRSCGGSASIT